MACGDENVKLSDRDISEIKDFIRVRDEHLKRAGKLSASNIGKLYGVSRHTVNRISTGEYREKS